MKDRATASTKVKIFRHDHIWNNDIISTFAASAIEGRTCPELNDENVNSERSENETFVRVEHSKFWWRCEWRENDFFLSKILHRVRPKMILGTECESIATSIKLINCIQRKCRQPLRSLHFILESEPQNKCALRSGPFRASCVRFEKIMPTSLVALAHYFMIENITTRDAITIKTRNELPNNILCHTNVDRVCVSVCVCSRSSVTHVDHSRETVERDKKSNSK